MLKKTPLHSLYKDKSKLIPFGEWELPVTFSSIKEEHNAVRKKVGLFDVSHMGEIRVKGSNSEKFLQKVLTNDISTLKINKTLYTVMCNSLGGTVDDLLVSKLGENDYFLVVNAANTKKDLDWLNSHVMENVEITDQSEVWAQLALQGPKSESLLQHFVDTDLKKIGFFNIMPEIQIAGFNCLLSRSGYTGEDGFEIYLEPDNAPKLWTMLLEKGQSYGILPCGLGARDTLRFEASLPLYGNELTEDISPIEAGLDFVVKLDKADFIGKDILSLQKKDGLKRKLVGLEMIDRGIPRHDYDVNFINVKIGKITTGTHSPTLDKSIGLALIDERYSEPDNVLVVKIRNKSIAAKVINTPFYKRPERVHSK